MEIALFSTLLPIHYLFFFYAVCRQHNVHPPLGSLGSIGGAATAPNGDLLFSVCVLRPELGQRRCHFHWPGHLRCNCRIYT